MHSTQGTLQISWTAKGKLALTSSPALEWVHEKTFGLLGQNLLKMLVIGVGEYTRMKKKKERGCLLSSLRSVKLLAARVPVWPLRVNFHFQTNIRIAPFGTRRGPRRQYVITFLKFYFPSLLLSSYLMTCKSHFALSNRNIKVGLIQKNNSLPKFDFALQPGGLFRLN